MSGRKRPVHFEDFSRRSKYRFFRSRRNIPSESSESESELVNRESIPEENIQEDYVSDNEAGIIAAEWYSSNEEDVDYDSNLDDDNDHTDLDSNFERDNDASVADDLVNEDNDNILENEEDPKLYADAPITLNESLICILTFAIQFSLTGVALASLLKLISLHCPVENICKKSLFLFRKYFARVNIPLCRRYYCGTCYNNLDANDSICDICIEVDPAADSNILYFIEIPLGDQLKTIYRRPGFVELLQSRFYRNKNSINNYEDIYDGQIYRSLSEPTNFLSQPNNISFTWNTDGVSIFKSSKFQIWPFYLSINELPFSQRTRKDNLLLAGLWFGPKKPKPAVFLNHISRQLNELEVDGIDVEVPGRNQPVHLHAKVIGGSCDLPAKALFLNMKQFNGEYGCQKCLIQSKSLEEASMTRVYLFQENLTSRTQEQTNNLAREAVVSGDAILGVKGPSAISRFLPNYIQSTAVDYMHCVYLGVVRALLLIWFHPSNGIFSKFTAMVDQKIQLITPPDFVRRLPRSIVEHIMYLKASELKTWFFYYSIPILQPIMSVSYFDHHLLLVYSIYTLNQASISDEMVDLAEDLLKQYVSQFEDLYGREHMTANLHQLLHLAQNVRDFGPLWTSSCFPYENANGILKTLVTGTKFAHLQICSGVSTFISLPELTKNLVPNSQPANFCDILTNKQKNKYKLHTISADLSIVGCFGKLNNQLPEILTQALRAAGINSENIRVFYRLFKNGILYTSELYQRCRKTNSSFVKCKNHNNWKFGSIFCFLKISECNCHNFCRDECNAQYFVVIRKYQTISPFSVESGNNRFELYFMQQCTRTETISVVEFCNLGNVCFYVDTKMDNLIYIVEPVNMLESE